MAKTEKRAQSEMSRKDKWELFFSTISGRFILTLSMGITLCAYRFHDYVHMICLVLCSVFLAYFTTERLKSMAPFAILMIVISPGSFGLPPNSPLSIFIFLLVSIVFLLLAARYKRRGIFRHPVTFFITLILVGALLCEIPGIAFHYRMLIMQIITVLVIVKWMFVYAIMNITGRKNGTVLENIGTFGAFNSTYIPAGMGLGWLKKFEVKTAKELASSQLDAVRLMFYILFFQLIKGGIKLFSTSVVHAPNFYECIKAFAEGHPYSHWISLYSLLSRFIYQMVGLYCFANLGVAIAKFSGFNMPQGSMNILYSRDIADFWNRIFFYYKEVMVNFFFYPTFKYLSTLPDRLRIFLATFAAAGFGCYIHAFLDGIGDGYALHVGFLHYSYYSLTYGFYCLLLALGIGLSQIWSSYGSKREPDPHFHVGRFLLIMLFYGLINTFDMHAEKIFGAENGEADLLTHLKYLAYMLGVF